MVFEPTYETSYPMALHKINGQAPIFGAFDKSGPFGYLVQVFYQLKSWPVFGSVCGSATAICRPEDYDDTKDNMIALNSC